MRSFVTLLLSCLAVGSLAAPTLRTGRDADAASAEVFSAEFRSTALVDLTEERSPRHLIHLPLKVLKELRSTALVDLTEERSPRHLIHLPLKVLKELRSTALLDLTEQRSPRHLIPLPLKVLKKLLITAKVAALVLVATGTIDMGNMSLPIELQEFQSLVSDVSEFLVELPAILQLGSRRDTMADEATQALQDLDKLLDEGAVTAVAKLQGGVHGELSFVQTRYADGNRAGNDVTIISGTLAGLTPGVHKLQVTLKGDISNDCYNAGEAYSDKSDGIFLANDKGNALVVVRAAKAPPRGTDTVLGRSVVITSEADPDKREACGVIVHPGS